MSRLADTLQALLAKYASMSWSMATESTFFDIAEFVCRGSCNLSEISWINELQNGNQQHLQFLRNNYFWL